MITIEQCRAARGLINWTQQDLANASGLSKTAINNFEKGNSSIKADSLNAIQRAFENVGIEFLTDNGLRKKGDASRILKGKDAMTELINDIANTLEKTGGEVLIYNVTEGDIIKKALKNLLARVKNPTGENFRMRVLCAQSETENISSSTPCRWTKPSTSASNTPFYIYGQKVAISLWEQSMIIIINSPEASAAERAHFEIIWESSNPSNQPTTSPRANSA